MFLQSSHPPYPNQLHMCTKQPCDRVYGMLAKQHDPHGPGTLGEGAHVEIRYEFLGLRRDGAFTGTRKGVREEGEVVEVAV
jgi:hypothetical protein